MIRIIRRKPSFCTGWKKKTESDQDPLLDSEDETETETEAETGIETIAGVMTEIGDETKAETGIELSDETEAETEVELSDETEAETEIELSDETEAETEPLVLVSEGADYRIVVTCGHDAGIPYDAELKVSAILPEKQDNAQDAH